MADVGGLPKGFKLVPVDDGGASGGAAAAAAPAAAKPSSTPTAAAEDAKFTLSQPMDVQQVEAAATEAYTSSDAYMSKCFPDSDADGLSMLDDDKLSMTDLRAWHDDLLKRVNRVKCANDALTFIQSADKDTHNLLVQAEVDYLVKILDKDGLIKLQGDLDAYNQVANITLQVLQKTKELLGKRVAFLEQWVSTAGFKDHLPDFVQQLARNTATLIRERTMQCHALRERVRKEGLEAAMKAFTSTADAAPTSGASEHK